MPGKPGSGGRPPKLVPARGRRCVGCDKELVQRPDESTHNFNKRVGCNRVCGRKAIPLTVINHGVTHADYQKCRTRNGEACQPCKEVNAERSRAAHTPRLAPKCSRGHWFQGANVGRTPGGYRRCVSCRFAHIELGRRTHPRFQQVADQYYREITRQQTALRKAA
jgi:hypothetical protein